MPDEQSPKDIPLSVCAAVLTLHYFQDKSWLEISALLPVGPDTAEEIWNRAKVLSGVAVSIVPKLILVCTGTCGRSYGY